MRAVSRPAGSDQVTLYSGNRATENEEAQGAEARQIRSMLQIYGVGYA
jgi:hypothetical protein